MVRYAPERMYGAETAFARNGTFLRGMRPAVLAASELRVLQFDVGSFHGPIDLLGEPAQQRPVKLLNPSLVAAPEGLCERCAFVAAVRADTLHQCDTSSPLWHLRQGQRLAAAAYFKNTALVVLDSKLRVLGWIYERRVQLHDD